MIHALKIHPEYFEGVIAGRKTFEVRWADRPFDAGDLLALNEYNPALDTYTGRYCLVYVDYLWSDPKYVREGYVIMSIKPCYISRAGEDLDLVEFAVPCYGATAEE